MKSIKFKVQKFIRDPLIIFNLLASKKLLNWLPDQFYLKILFYVRMRSRLNIIYPKTFNEKLQWLKLYDRNPNYTSMVDKYEVRQYIKEKIGEEYLIPLVGVWNKFDDIDFDKLPEQFVLKSTHDSGGVVICKDKSEFDIEAARKKINKSLKRNYYLYTKEWPYKNIKPRIICEKFMVNESGKELNDFKLMCFNGKVQCTFVCLNRNSATGLNIDIYDTDWNLMPFERPNHPNSGIKIDRPKNYKKMIDFSEKLSRDIPFLRVDFYEINGHLYFGELTFYPGSGFEKFKPESYDMLMGNWITLPINKSTK